MHLHSFTMCKQLSFYFSMCFEGSPPREQQYAEGVFSFYSSMFSRSHKKKVVYMCGGLCIHGFSWGLGAPSVSHLQEKSLVHEPPLKHYAKNIKQAQGNEISQYKSTATIFSSSLPICPIHIFSSNTQACFALVTSCNTACFALVTSYNMPSNMLHSTLCP
jgi:hypothetical protein